MSRRKRRDNDIFNLSFLDCICCGFGAIVLLLVLSKQYEPIVIEQTREELDGVIARLEAERVELVGETRDLERKKLHDQGEQSGLEEKIARLQGDLSEILGRFRSSNQDSAVRNIIKGKLANAQQELSEEMERLYGKGYRRIPTDRTVGGIPVDSEYIIFIIDTSGSMQRFSWDMVSRKLTETLNVYPQVKGIQVMNDMGEYMFRTYAKKWIPDTPGRRRAIIRRMLEWKPFSNSSPVEGISEAIRRFRSVDKKISLYVLGDEFTGTSIAEVVETIDKMVLVDEEGNQNVRIHGIGFPIPSSAPQGVTVTNKRFAALMRILCERNGGAFVGLTRDSRAWQMRGI